MGQGGYCSGKSGLVSRFLSESSLTRPGPKVGMEIFFVNMA